MSERLVFSTGEGSKKKDKTQKNRGSQTPASGPTKMRLEKKGRGGKAVTVLFNLSFPEAELTALKKELQSAFGVGATLKNGSLELQGDLRDKVMAFFAERGLKLVQAGG